MLTAIYRQLDPIRLAEIDRSLKISHDYGERLTHDGNLKEGAIVKLLAKYPSHGFVIDRKEAGELFSKVDPPTKELAEIMQYFRPVAEWTIEQDQNFVLFASDEPVSPAPSDPAAQRQAYSTAPRGTPAPEAVT